MVPVWLPIGRFGKPGSGGPTNPGGNATVSAPSPIVTPLKVFGMKIGRNRSGMPPGPFDEALKTSVRRGRKKKLPSTPQV